MESDPLINLFFYCMEVLKWQRKRKPQKRKQQRRKQPRRNQLRRKKLRRKRKRRNKPSVPNFLFGRVVSAYALTAFLILRNNRMLFIVDVENLGL